MAVVTRDATLRRAVKRLTTATGSTADFVAEAAGVPTDKPVHLAILDARQQNPDKTFLERVPAGAALEREAFLELPSNARPTGPATPDGRIRWQLEVLGEAGWLRATYWAFEIGVEGSAAPAGAPARPAEGDDATADVRRPRGGACATRSPR